MLPFLLEITNPESEFRTLLDKRANEAGWELSETRITNSLIFEKLDQVVKAAFFLNNRITSLLQREKNRTIDINSFFEVHSSFTKLFEDFAHEIIRETHDNSYYIKTDIDQIMNQILILNKRTDIEKILLSAKDLGFDKQLEAYRQNQEQMKRLVAIYFSNGLRVVK